MGAADFVCRSKGRTAAAAFQRAREKATWEYGHGGYTGTIAEKHDFIIIPCPAGVKPEDRAQELLDNEDTRIEDKWGPAGCIKIRHGEYLFFGFASS